jgi:hypothetical protein
MAEFYRLVRMEDDTSFWQRHRRWFDFAATIVVAGTFIVNEGLRNEARDLAESIEKDQLFFATSTEIEAMAKRLLEVQTQLTSLARSKNERSPVRPAEPKDQTDRDADEAEAEYPSYVQAVSILENAMMLYSKLPYNKLLDDEHWKLTREIELEHRFTDDAFALSLDSHLGKVDRLESLKQRIAVEKSEMQKERQQSEVSIPTELDGFGASVLKRANDIHEFEEGRAKLWKHISYILYPLGIIIGLIGKIFGGDDSVGEQAG